MAYYLVGQWHDGVYIKERGERIRPGYDCIWDMVFTCACGDKKIDNSLHTWYIIALWVLITVFTLNADLKTAAVLTQESWDHRGLRQI